MHSIPTKIDDVTADWLASVTGLPITSIAAKEIGAGLGVIGAVYRVECTGADGCPKTLVVKLPGLDEAAVFTGSILRMYLREVRFYDRMASRVPVRVPDALHAAIDEETSAFVVVMEDMGALRVVDQVAGMALDDAERAVDKLAAWHATFWGEGEQLAEEGITVSLADPIYPAVLPMVFAEGWEKVTSELAVSPALERAGKGWPAVYEQLLVDLATPPTTMTHGDYRADNILFTAEDEVALLDFQLSGTASGAYDLAYFVTQSLEPAVASANEKALFDRYVNGLRAAGVPESDLGRLWEDYRKAALFCLVYPIVAARGMDLSDPRQRALVECMNERFERAVEELDLEELL
jgi:aminoglycoside phosphotransferase (APT) family kinase protein